MVIILLSYVCSYVDDNKRYHRQYLTVILQTQVVYELIADEARSTKSAIAHIRRERVE